MTPTSAAGTGWPLEARPGLLPRLSVALVAAAVALTTAAGPLGMPQHALVAQLVAHATQPNGAAAASVILAEQVVVDDIEATLPVRYDPCADGAPCAQGDGPACPPTGLAVERGLSSDALRVLRCIEARFPQVTTFHGVGARPNESDHPGGRAVDAMIPSWHTPSGNALGWQVAHWARANQACLGVTYVIWAAMIWSADRPADGWRPYRHPNGWPDANSLHRNHVHVSVRGSAGFCADGQVVSLPGDDVIAANHSFGLVSSNPTRTAANPYPDPEQPASPAPYEPARKPDPGPTQDDPEPDPTPNPDPGDDELDDPDGQNPDEGDTGDDDPAPDEDQDQGEPGDEPEEPEEPEDPGDAGEPEVDPEPEDPESPDNDAEDDPGDDEPDDQPDEPEGPDDGDGDDDSADEPEDSDNPGDEPGDADDTESGDEPGEPEDDDEPDDTESGDEPDEPESDDEGDEATNSS